MSDKSLSQLLRLHGRDYVLKSIADNKNMPLSVRESVEAIQDLCMRAAGEHESQAAQIAALTAERDALKGWRDAIDEALCVAHLGVATEPYDDLNKLMQWHHDIWLDPAVSSDAQALVDRGAEAARREADALRGALQEAEEYIGSYAQANGAGLRDHDHDKYERRPLLVKLRAARAARTPAPTKEPKDAQG